MTQAKWIDVTSDILKLPQSFKLLQVVKDQKFILQDGMHAHEINDNKIDPKYNISVKDTITYMLSQNKIKLPHQLSQQQLLALFIQVLKLQTLISKGQPLHNTIYTLTYLYDQKIYSRVKGDQKNNLSSEVIHVLVNSINCLGSYIYELHKQSSSIKEDDLNISMYSYSKKFDANEQIVKDFSNIEILLTNKAKQHKDKSTMYDQLISLIKLRRLVHSLTKSMGKYYDSKLNTKIQKDIQNVYTIISSIQRLFFQSQNNIQLNTMEILKGTNIFSNNISKSLRSHFGIKELPAISLRQSIQHIKLVLKQFELFIPVPSRLCILKDRIQRLHDMPLSIWSKSYIKNNLFHKEDHIFNTLKTQQVIINDMNDYIQLKQSWKQEQKFVNLLKPTSPVVSQVIFRYLGLNSRSFWQVSKIYEDYNILIHLSNQFDAYVHPPNKKQLHLSSWYYHFGLNVMIKQLFVGIQTQLYQHYEYPYVFYLLENLLGVYDRNSQVFVKKFDKTYVTSFNDETLNKSKKKKVPQASRKYFTDSVFKKGLHYYVRSFHRILFVLVNRKLIENPFSQNLQNRIKNRFRIFKNVYFVRSIDYKQYLRDYQIICQDQNGYLTQAMDLLKEAKNIFQKIAQLQESDCNYKVKQDAESLIKICIKCSLTVMSLKMNQNTKTFKIQNKHPKYPEITVC